MLEKHYIYIIKQCFRFHRNLRYSKYVCIIKQLFYSLSSYMSDSQLGATHLLSYQLIYDESE